MALTIKLTLPAEKGLDKELIYLEECQSIDEILNSEEAIKRVLIQISLNPELLPHAENYKDLRKALVDKNKFLIYR